jgi:hypothetical protein
MSSDASYMPVCGPWPQINFREPMISSVKLRIACSHTPSGVSILVVLWYDSVCVRDASGPRKG